MPFEEEFSSDILQPIPLEEWSLLQKLLQVDWPMYSNYYYWLENSIRWKTRDPGMDLEVYAPQGRFQDDVTFVGISKHSMYSIVVFTRESSGKRLYNALVETNRINWNKDVTFSGIHECVQPLVFSALATLETNRGIQIHEEKPGCFYFKSASDSTNMEIRVPDECYLGDLNSSHVPTIHEIYPHIDVKQPENSIAYLETTIKLNKSYGLFLKKGDVLVSWAIHSEWYGLGMVQTQEGYKRRGYAKVVVLALAKWLGERGISPILSIVVGNTISENMFTSLNWKPNHLATWITMKRILKTSPEPAS